MAHVLIIGASKGVGLETTRQALEGGHQVRALARSAAGIRLSDQRLEKIQGDALNRRDIEAALDGIGALIAGIEGSAIGTFRKSGPGPSKSAAGGRPDITPTGRHFSV